ncbi:MAG: hypothetical protein KAF91_00975 [Nostoc sp. TH1S01]|nr:hypothetical protein [Nostoc sp. TH1S01]
MRPIKRPIKPAIYISFLYIYETTWGTAGDICLIRESVVKDSTTKFIGHKVRLVVPKRLERDRVANFPVIKVAGNVGEGHPKEHPYEWEVYEGVDREIAIAALKPWGFKLIDQPE